MAPQVLANDDKVALSLALYLAFLFSLFYGGE
jgi:hypothetical protein